jgi:hypothetical protein
MESLTKHCGRCKLVLPLESFAHDRKRKDGRFGYCRDCWAAFRRGRVRRRITERVASRMAAGAKTCPRCGEIKQFTEFYKNRNTADGCTWLCKVCFLEDIRDRTEHYETSRMNTAGDH